MPSEPEKLLVAALRSGEFAQTQQHLRVGDSYCCLGVACEVYRRRVNPGMNWEPGCGESYFLDCGTELPEPVREWLGWLHPTAETSISDLLYETDLASLNDEGLTFDQIADVIEAGLVIRRA